MDFSFVYEELNERYCQDNGRTAVDPVRMFKYLLLKSIHYLSDADLVERSKTDLSFKFFLHMAPEDEVIDPSLLSKFRKLRLKDMKLLDLLISKTVEIAIRKGIIRSKSIIVNATHTKARYTQKSPQEVLRERSKKVRKTLYALDESRKRIFPTKPVTNVLEDEMEYCQQLIAVIEQDERFTGLPKVSEALNLLKETIIDDAEHLQTSTDPDAKVGHKSADSSFFGYKTHIAMSEERIITAATITTGEKSDGKELQTLIEKSKAAGMSVETVIGDTAYSERDNIGYSTEHEIELVTKLNPMITQGTARRKMSLSITKMRVCMSVRPGI